jgi:hypothetical protein
MLLLLLLAAPALSIIGERWGTDTHQQLLPHTLLSFCAVTSGWYSRPTQLGSTRSLPEHSKNNSRTASEPVAAVAVLMLSGAFRT